MDFYEHIERVKADNKLGYRDLGEVVNKSADAFRMKFRRKGLNTLEKVMLIRHFDLLNSSNDLEIEEDVRGAIEQIDGIANVIPSSQLEPDAVWVGDLSVMMVPMVSYRAQAGFLAGWEDAAAISLKDFPKIPWEVDKEYKGRYVCFEVTGDSMDNGTTQSLLDGDTILCREIVQQHWHNKLHINKWDFVIAHKEKGIVVKRIVEHEVETGRLVLHSLNDFYDDYEVYLQDCIAIFNVVDIKRVWKR